MNEYALRMERDFRTIRNRLRHEVRGHEDECLALYLLDSALDTVESGNAGVSAHELQLPPDLPKRDWCRNCKGSCKRPR